MHPIHPFPARMAPDISRAFIRGLPIGSQILDPMCGSGTVLRHAVEAGHSCVGQDVDPLAVLMASAWTTAVPAYRLAHDAHEIVRRAKALSASAAEFPWSDEETDQFARYWFARQQMEPLARLAAALKASRYKSRDLLRVCLSRLIITKERGASLARDVSHSRPHRVTLENSFDPYAEFLRAARLVAKRLDPDAIRGHATVELGDARLLGTRCRQRFDVAITSPPYLNAIDYLRGHRLALIWFGYSIGQLRSVRSTSTGSERAQGATPFDIAPYVVSSTDALLAERYQGWIRHYASDMADTFAGLRAVVRPGGKVMLVVGNSLIRGSAVDNAGIVTRCAQAKGLRLVEKRERTIPARRRYLPLPSDGSALARRMRSESVLTFEVPIAPIRDRVTLGDSR